MGSAVVAGRVRLAFGVGAVAALAWLGLRARPPTAPADGTAPARITVVAVGETGAPIARGVVALEHSDDGVRFTDVTTLSLDAQGRQSYPLPSTGTWRARLVAGGGGEATWTEGSPDGAPARIRSSSVVVDRAEGEVSLRVVAPVGGSLRLQFPSQGGPGVTVLRRPSAPYVLAPVPFDLARTVVHTASPARPESVLRWRDLPCAPWQVLVRPDGETTVAASGTVHPGHETDVAAPASPPADGPVLTYDGPERSLGFRLDRWDDPIVPDHAADRLRPATPTSVTGVRPGAYLLRLTGLDAAMILRHDGTSRTVRVAPPPPPPPGGVTVRVRVQADGLDVHRVFVGLVAGDTSLADGTWLRSARGPTLDHVPPGRHTLVILDGLDLYVVGIPGGVHTHPLDVGATDLTATVVLR